MTGMIAAALVATPALSQDGFREVGPWTLFTNSDNCRAFGSFGDEVTMAECAAGL